MATQTAARKLAETVVFAQQRHSLHRRCVLAELVRPGVIRRPANQLARKVTAVVTGRADSGQLFAESEIPQIGAKLLFLNR